MDVMKAVYTAAAFLFLAAGGASAADVTVDYDRQADLSRCATYAWRDGLQAPDPLMDKRIVAAVDGALSSKGWQKVTAGAACYVTYDAYAREERSLRVWDAGRLRGGFGSVDVNTTVKGSLIVGIWTRDHELMWRAVAKDTVSDKPEKNQKQLAGAVQRMFRDLPAAAQQ
jgi:hypothetical protein